MHIVCTNETGACEKGGGDRIDLESEEEILIHTTISRNERVCVSPKMVLALYRCR